VKPPNFLLLITDQQRAPRHWPDDPGWLRDLMPNDAEIQRTGVNFRNAFCSSAMCSPSRASLLTGLYPPEHGVELTLTAADLKPNPRYAPAVAATMAGILRHRQAPARRTLTQFTRGLLGIGSSRGNETELPARLPNMARLLRAAGYHVAYKGKWHLTHPSDGDDGLLGGWGESDERRLEREYGFADWQAPDAGENAKAEHFGGGNAGEGEGWDEVYTRQVEEWLSRSDLPEPFCLIVSLVNPHDVLGYPASYERGGYTAAEFRDLGVGLPPTIDEDLTGKPAVHSLMQMGMTAYMGPLRDRREQRDYVNFYAYLHRVVDAKIGRVLMALGDPTDPDSLRSRTVLMRCADHGEMGLSHGGLRQKTFNVYEETINVPLVVSNPLLFPRGGETDSLASLVDVLPTMLELGGIDAPGGLRGRDQTPVLAQAASPDREPLGLANVDLSPVTEHAAPADSVREDVHFTYDDHQAGTAMTEAPGQPNRIRSIRTGGAKYAFYFDPQGRRPTEYELYDLERDPLEVENLLGVRSGRPRDRASAALHGELSERLEGVMEACGTTPGKPAASGRP
jgi:arylsulfatase A-like enzyme